MDERKKYSRLYTPLNSINQTDVSVSGINATNIGSNNFFVFTSDYQIEKIKDAVMLSDIPAEMKVKVYNIIMDIIRGK